MGLFLKLKEKCWAFQQSPSVPLPPAPWWPSKNPSLYLVAPECVSVTGWETYPYTSPTQVQQSWASVPSGEIRVWQPSHFLGAS